MSLPPPDPKWRLKARAAAANPDGRFERERRAVEHDGWDIPEDERLLRTEVALESPRRIITRNDSPDVPFDQSLNPYRGCEHGCIYCFARPSHSYLGLSPGLDFETRLTAKPEAAARLAAELRAPSYRVQVLAMGTNTDPYQPIEAERGITRQVLQVLSDFNHPVAMVTRGATILRDLELWASLAARGLGQVGISLTTLDAGLARAMEPRAPTPATRLRMIRELSAAGVPVRVMAAPMIPVLTGHELEPILTAAREAGATAASTIPIRLPHEVAPLFRDWLTRHRPAMAQHVMNRIQAIRGGRDNDPRFGSRMRGEGVEAELMMQRFRLAARKLGFTGHPGLRTDLFAPPPRAGDQLSLF